MRESSRNWMEKVTRKIGMGGSVDFNTTAVGKTLHIPCRHGNHFVDFPIPAHIPPDTVVKKMLAAGWTVGNHPKCPDCSRKSKTNRGVAGATKRWEGTTAEERSAHMKMMRSKVGEKDEKIMMTSTITPSAPAKAAADASDAARKAHRLVMQCLEDYYDEQKKCYRPGHSDKRIADETGASEASVKKTREEYFGPLGEPEELTEVKTAVRDADAAFREVCQNHAKAIARLQEKLKSICEKNGWPVE